MPPPGTKIAFWSYRQLVLALAALTTLTVSEQWASVDRAETSF
jgi:hypothetical protein